VQDSWLKLDLHYLNHFKPEELKKTASDFIDFMKHYEFVQKAVEIKSNIYNEAIKYMKKDISYVKEKAEEGLSVADEKIKKIIPTSVKDTCYDAKEKVKETYENVKDKVSDTYEKVKDKVQEKSEQMKE